MAEINSITKEIVDSAQTLYGDLLNQILLYGSYARGDYSDESDVDVMILLDCNDDDLKRFRKSTSRMASRIGLENDVEVSLLLRDRKTFDGRRAILPFYDNVRREGVVLYGQRIDFPFKYRFEKAERCLRSSKVLVEDGDYKGAANRSYYAIFHGMRSVLALEPKDFAKHSGVSAYFRKEYIKTGIFDVEMSDYIKEAFDVREDSDYDDYYIVSRAEVIEQINNAETFLNAIKPFLEERYAEK